VIWCGVTWCGVMWCGVMWCDVWCDMMWCGVAWYDVVWCDVVWCDMMWSDVMWSDVMWCGVMWCVVWCDVMCGVIWCDVMWCDMMWCDVWRDMMWCDVMSEVHSFIVSIWFNFGTFLKKKWVLWLINHKVKVWWVRQHDPPAESLLALPPLKCSLWSNFRNTKQNSMQSTISYVIPIHTKTWNVCFVILLLLIFVDSICFVVIFHCSVTSMTSTHACEQLRSKMTCEETCGNWLSD
jgi:hypothetical protein